jgi:hypothetical protein
MLPKTRNGVTLPNTMDTPRSMDVSSAQPLFGRALRAIGALEASTKLAIICVVFGWFFMNTLVVNLGSLQHGVRFFDIGAVIADPTRLFFGVDTSFQRVFFALICLVCLSAPLAPHLVKKHAAWLGYVAPFALMALSGVILYSRTSGEFFSAPSDANSLSGSLIHFANDLVHRGSDMVSRHVAIGAGGYLAFIGCAVLAVQGVRHFRHPGAI